MKELDSFIDWYKKGYILWNILDCSCFDREISVNAINLRTEKKFHKKSLSIGKIDYLREVLMNEKEVVVDIYSSLQIYNKEDMSKLHKPGVTRKEKQEFFHRTVPKGYLVAFDLDGEIQEMANQALEILNLMNQKGHKVQVIFSGKKGFHIETDILFPAFDGTDRGVYNWKNYCLSFVEGFNVDDKIYSFRREWRAPYSLHSETGKVVLPLSYEHLKFFAYDPDSALERMTPNHILQMERLYNRGKIWL